MIKQFQEKLKESFFSVAPIMALVLVLCATPLLNLSLKQIIAFIIASLIIIVGIALFNMGADIAMTPMGKIVGNGLTKRNKITLLLLVSFIIGLLITIAEPDLTVLANQVSEVLNGTVLIIVVGVGVAIFLVIAILKIAFKIHLSSLLMYFYMFLFALSILVSVMGNTYFLPIAFDSGGVTTGPITVPFVMALGIGIASSFSSRESKENSFGFIALCSAGAVLGVLILSIFIKGNLHYQIADYSLADNLVVAFIFNGLNVMKEVGISLGLIVVFFLICQFTFLKLSKEKIFQIFIGIIYTFIGLVLFLTAVNTIYTSIGFSIGNQLANANKYILIPIGFVVGVIVVLAEPAIHVLTKQVQETTNNMISKKSMLIGLSVGVGISICLSMVRIIFDFNIMFYLVPGYLISLGLSFFVPSIYTAIAFDSGGVASGPLTSSFILPLAIGVCSAVWGNASILQDAFGIVAMVAMTPLITIQFLGFRAIAKRNINRRIAMSKILSKNDGQIIDFN